MYMTDFKGPLRSNLKIKFRSSQDGLSRNKNIRLGSVVRPNAGKLTQPIVRTLLVWTSRIINVSFSLKQIEREPNRKTYGPSESSLSYRVASLLEDVI